MSAVPPFARDRARQFATGCAGVAAVEFSLILPVALLMLALVIYGGQAFSIQRKVELSAATVANLVARGGTPSPAAITNPEMTQILGYPNLILYPNDASAVQVVVSELQVSSGPGAATGTVVGSWANANASARPCNQQLPINANIVAAFTGGASAYSNSSPGYVMLGEIVYPFSPPAIYGSVPPLTLHSSILMIPRANKEVTGPTMCPT
jgi:Flp pilus assembly protein TadG